MIPPHRLKDETRDPFARALLESARDDRPAPGARERAAIALGLGAGAGHEPPAPGGGSLGALKWCALAFLGTAVIAGSIALAPRSSAPSPTYDFPTTVASPLPDPAPAPDSSPADSVPIDTYPAPPQTTPRPVPRRPTPSASLAEQMALLDTARTHLAAHDPNGALSTLDELDTRFPRGAFREEATVLRIEGLLAKGDRPRAESLAHTFLTAHPKSAYTRRVRSLMPER